MRSTRKRARKIDPLASPMGVCAVLDQLRKRCPDIIPSSERQLLKMLTSVRHIELHRATDTRRGRPSRWHRKDLLEVASHLRVILECETSGRLSLSSFTGQYLRILNFPTDVVSALERGQINLQEAAQLARLSASRLGCTDSVAGARRAELLQSHLATQGSQTSLRLRVKEILGETTPEISSAGMAAAVAVTDELLEIDPADSRHLFWEEMKRIFFAMRNVQPEDLDDDILGEFISAIDQVSAVLRRVEKRRQERSRRGQGFTA